MGFVTGSTKTNLDKPELTVAIRFDQGKVDRVSFSRSGADGYLLKTVELDRLSESIIKVLDGESVVSPEMMTKLVAAFRSKAPPTSNGEVAAVNGGRNGDAPVPGLQDEPLDFLSH